MLANASICHSQYWGSRLMDKYMVELEATSSITHKHVVYETALPKPYKIVHQDEDGDDAEDPDDLSMINEGHEVRAKRRHRLKVTVDDKNQIVEVECG
ncbi:hypothetical protein DL89DRAFT_267806 [Linderina pennispora]|uniref:Uncharacterized protein n=1 Tax=Linderina pennispora TaxID=61395 RepID=A0A1Y1W8Q8_9FUNG|nr:uncharacterized protein DL89DRAFT_267806 [Linderina pennispora]ORX69626.1 hypothetical protein DL89DRAFT_267806 [Linderina pennispora]